MYGKLFAGYLVLKTYKRLMAFYYVEFRRSNELNSFEFCDYNEKTRTTVIDLDQ